LQYPGLPKAWTQGPPGPAGDHLLLLFLSVPSHATNLSLGIITLKTEPRPCLLLTRMDPCNNSTAFFTMDNPRPVPGNSSAAFPLTKGSKITSRSFLAIPIPSS